MRTQGTLARWNDDRGFGFIQPAVGTDEIFVHISAFPRDGIRPRIGELVSFEIDLGGDGRKRALRVMRPGSGTASHRGRQLRASTRQSPLMAIAGLLLFALVGWYGYAQFTARHATDSTPLPPSTKRAPPAPAYLASPAPALTRTAHPLSHSVNSMSPRTADTIPAKTVLPEPAFHCDGRTRCPQMTSCAEATFFLRQCPGTRMDGNRDGVPCEEQWCG